MSPRAIKLLHDVARARGMTETDVVEFCVAKYAVAIGQDVDRAKELLFEQICRAAANSPVLHSRADDTSSLALNEETGRGARESIAEGQEGRRGRKDEAVDAATATGQSAAGEIAAIVGERWTKKEKGKRKN